MTFKLGKRSLQRLEGVHPDLVECVEQAILITSVDFTVLEGVRSVERQRKLFAAGATTTMNSRHLTGHAVDLGAWVDGQVRWDWPLYDKIAEAMREAAQTSGLNTEFTTRLEWGGDWKTFKDGPHFQLSWNFYPKE